MAQASTRATLLERFEGHAKAHPERLAVSFGETSLSYRELNRRANELAHRMLALGVPAGGRVGVCLRPCLGVLISLLAIQKIGGCYVPMDPDYPLDRLRGMAEDAGLQLTLSQPELIDRLGGTLSDLHSYEPPAGTVDPTRFDNLAIPVDSDEIACVFYTSGTTGQPKGIALSYGNLSYYVLAAIDQFGMSEADTTLSIARFSFSISLFDLLTSMVAGGRLVLLPRDQVMNYGDLAAALRPATVAHIGPSLLKGLVRHIRGAFRTFEAFAGLRHLSSGGDFVPADLQEHLKAVFPQAELFVIYGCTEIACMGCFHPIPRTAPVLRSYLGKPFPGTECVLLGEDGVKVPDGEAGEICFHGPGVMSGYLNLPDLTQRAFIDIDGTSFYRTGDLGRRDATGCLEFLGRRDFQIKLRGQRIEVVEIESHLRQAPGVRDAVVALTGSRADESRLVAYLTVEDQDGFSLEPIRDYLRSKLPDYMQPSGWVLLERMPLNINLKISRKDLPLPTAENMVDTESHVEPRTELERTLARVWQEVLGLPRVGIHDHFFHLGGDSLLAMNACMLAAEYGLRMSPTQLANAPTIAQLVAEGIAPEIQDAEGSLDDLTDAKPVHIPPVIHRFLYERGDTSPHHWNISRVLAARKQLDPLLLERTFRSLGARHDALRLRFERTGSRWSAQVRPVQQDTLVFRRVDLTGLSGKEQTAGIRDVARDCHRSVNLTHGPLACLALFDLGEGRPQEVLFVVHHFAMDVISWKNFWMEFDSVYRRLEAGGDASMGRPPLSFSAWTELLQPHANSPVVVADVQAWLDRDWSALEVPTRGLDRQGGANTNSSAHYLSVVLSEAETLSLTTHASAGITFESLLISALAVAVGKWQSTGLVHFDRLVHGRNAAPAGLDVSRTLGCLISYAPTLLTLPEQGSAVSILREVATQLAQFGEAGTSVELYRHFGSDRNLLHRLERLPRAEVLFNYRGRVDDIIDRSHLFSKTYDLAGLDHDPTGIRLYPIAISADLVEHGLEVRFVYSTNLHTRQEIEGICADFRAFLEGILRG